MGGNLDHMSKTERYAIEQFGETVKSRLGEYVVKMSVFGSKVRGDYRTTADIDVLVIAKGSAAELRTQVYIACQIGIISNDIQKEFTEEPKKISSMVRGLIKSIQNLTPKTLYVKLNT